MRRAVAPVFSDAVQHDEIAPGGAQSQFQLRLVFVGFVPALDCFHIRELDDHGARAAPFAFQDIGVGGRDDPRAEFGQTLPYMRTVFFLSGRVGDFKLMVDRVCRHVVLS